MKTILITGVGKGIGRALAQKFLAEKYFVIGTFFSRKPDFEDINLRLYPLDLSSPKSIQRCAQKIKSFGRKIDIHINNAGALFDEYDTHVIIQKLRKTLEVNLIGLIDFTERILPCIRKHGHIINISSSAGSLTFTGELKSHFPHHYPSYKISKAALNMYTRTLALRLQKQGTIVSSVNPGWVKTDIGGLEADLTPEQAAQHIFRFAIQHPKTGNFWFAGKKIPW